MNEQDHAQELATAIRDRRMQLGMTQESMADRSKRLDPRGRGFSVRTVGDLERAERSELRASTIDLLDAVLEWPRGTTYAWLHGEDVPEVDSDLTARDVERLHTLERRVDELTDTVADLIEAIRLGDRLAQRRHSLSREDERA